MMTSPGPHAASLDPRLGVGLFDPSKPAPARLVSASNGAGPRPRNLLAKTVETADTEKLAQAMLSRRAMKDVGADLLYRSGNDGLRKLGVRLSHCCKVPHGQSPVRLLKGENGNGYLTGLARCSSVWACPTCSRRVSSARRDEVNAALERARALGLSPTLITLTASHSISDALGGPHGLLARMKAAKKRWQQLQAYRALKPVLRGSITVTEVTFGANGAHVHYHLIAFWSLAPGAALAAAETLRPAWIKALAAYDLRGNHAAFRVDPGHVAGDYITKGSWGAGEELALADRKVGRGSSRNPWQLLRQAAAGDADAARLWLSFVAAFKGARLMVWARGLRELLGVGAEIEDADIADPDASAEPVVLREWVRDPVKGWQRWKLAARRYVSLLVAVKAGSCLDAAEYGESDFSRWQRYLSESAVLE